MRRKWMEPLVAASAVPLAVLGMWLLALQSAPYVTKTYHGAYVPVSLAEMLDGAEAIVDGTVVAGSSRYTTDGEDIYTDWEFAVGRWLVGTGPDRIVVRTFGGTVGDATMVGDLEFERSKRYVVVVARGFGPLLDFDGQYATSPIRSFEVRGEWLEHMGAPFLGESLSQSYSTFLDRLASARAKR